MQVVVVDAEASIAKLLPDDIGRTLDRIEANRRYRIGRYSKQTLSKQSTFTMTEMLRPIQGSFGCHLHDTIYDLEGLNWSVGSSDDPGVCERFLELLGRIIVSTKP